MSKTKAASKPQILTEQALTKMFDRWALSVLGYHAAWEETAGHRPAGKHPLMELPRKKGERRKYEVLKPLPTKEEYLILRNAKYTQPLHELVSDAFSEFTSLAEELRSWYDNLPQGFQDGDKGQQLEEAASYLEDLSEHVLDSVKALPVLYLPDKASSRADRCSEACSMLEAAMEVLDNFIEKNQAEIDALKPGASELLTNDAEELKDELEEAKNTAESVEFPGMY